jgi:hypothetical protein
MALKPSAHIPSMKCTSRNLCWKERECSSARKDKVALSPRLRRRQWPAHRQLRITSSDQRQRHPRKPRCALLPPSRAKMSTQDAVPMVERCDADNSCFIIHAPQPHSGTSQNRRLSHVARMTRNKFLHDMHPYHAKPQHLHIVDATVNLRARRCPTDSTSRQLGLT